MINFNNDFLTFNEEAHRYHDQNGLEYTSVSAFFKRFEPVFDKENISKAVARKRGISQAEVLAEWEAMRVSSTDVGTRIHNALEDYDNDGVIAKGNEELLPMMREVREKYFKGYAVEYNEQRLYVEKYRIAGTADKLCHRKGKVVDIFDYKTNERRGIEFQDKYGKYLSAPIGHFEACNYNVYSLKCSLYGYMLEETFGLKVGRIAIIYINPRTLEHKEVPIPYLKTDVQNMLSTVKREREDVQNDLINW